MTTAYFELWTGLSGDMFVGAFLDAGWPEERLRWGIDALHLGKIDVEVERRKHGGFVGQGIRVRPEPDPPHRGYPEIRDLLGASELPERVRERATEVFHRLGEVEARIHGVSLSEIHFHEIGALDSIVDITSAVLALEEMGVERLLAGPVPLTRGRVETAHGSIPVPAPATAMLLEGWPVRSSPVEGEFVTPTAAALLQVLGHPAETMPPLRVRKVGHGAGTLRHPELPNLVRLWIGEEPDREETPAGVEGSGGEAPWIRRRICVLETQIDDLEPRPLAVLSDRLLDAGALDVLRVPVLMKKGRQGTLLAVLARPGSDTVRLLHRILLESTTLGVRVREEDRWELPRAEQTVDTALGRVRVKWSWGPAGPSARPEFEDVVRIALDRGLPVVEVQRRTEAELRNLEPPPIPAGGGPGTSPRGSSC